MIVPSLEEVLAGAVAFAVPLRAPFRGLRAREGVLIKGPSGWGEFAPFDDYDDLHAGRWLAAAIEAAWGSWPDPLRDAIDVNAIIPDVDSTRAGVLAREAVRELGCTTIKVKVGRSLAEDEARVVAVRDALDTAGVDGRIRLDANAAWSLDDAVVSLRRLRSYGIEYVEQPCADLADVIRIREELDVPVAVDEMIRTAEDPSGVTLTGLVDYAICKPMTLGGVDATLAIAESIGVPVVISGSLDTSVGLAASIAAAAAVPELTTACGLGTGVLLAGDVTSESLVPRNGRVPVGRIAPDLDALVHATQAISEDRARWWRDRLRRAYASYARMHAERRMEG